MTDSGIRKDDPDFGLQLALPLENPEQVFARAYRDLNLDRRGEPAFEVRFQAFATVRSKVRLDSKVRRIRADVSDVLRDAPPEVLHALATKLLSDLYLERVPPVADAVYNRWLHSPEIRQEMLRIQRERGTKHVRPPNGRAYDLSVEFDRVNERHFGGALRKPALGWSLRRSRTKMGHYDPAHDVIVISRTLDSPDVPALALEYVLFHEMLHLKHPVQLQAGRTEAHPPDFKADEARFPRLQEAKELLAAL